jgi:hypothetical protein
LLDFDVVFSVVSAVHVIGFAEAIARIVYQPGVMGYQFVTTHSVEALVAYGVAVELSADGMIGYQIVMTNCCLGIVTPY